MKSKFLINEISVSELFIKRVAEKAFGEKFEYIFKKYDIKDLMMGFQEEMESNIKQGKNPVDVLKIIMINLNKDSDYYKYKFKHHKELNEENNLNDFEKIKHYLIIKKSVDNIDDNKRDIIKKFVIFCSENLKLTESCKIFLCAERNSNLETTASYNPNNDNIWIYVKNRNMLGDILRSLAHEMMHFKQRLRNELHAESGKDGSPHENEAHTFAGMMIRKFGRMFPEIYI